jgi:hypothetical protein
MTRSKAMTTMVYAVHATMIDGAAIDLLRFTRRLDAENYKKHIETYCRQFGFDSLSIVPLRVIGPTEPLNRREKVTPVPPARRRRTDH